jgi:FlaA1/EpsC-like NDP-sugar epimerase
MLHQLKNKNLYIILAADATLMILSLLGAYLLRFEFLLTGEMFQQMVATLGWLVPLKIGVFLVFRAYRGMWRYVGMDDVWLLVKATSVAFLLAVALLIFIFRFQGYPRSIFILDYLLTLGLCAGLRLGIRSWFKGYGTLRGKWSISTALRHKKGKSIFILGAGDAGEKTLREIRDNPNMGYWVVGYLDDDPEKQDRTIHSVPVLGTFAELPALVKHYRIREILIAMPSVKGSILRRVIDACKTAKVPFKTLPGMGELIDGKVSLKALRDVNYKDLLRREPVQLDIDEISGYLKQKRILITGAGGSIGSELCRQIIPFQPELLILMDAAEPSLYSVQMELKHRAGYQRYKAILGSVTDAGLVDKILGIYQPHVIFHAAAYKHVPMIERNPWQAVTNNILGTKVMVEKAMAHHVGHFVMVSTDKAVRPTNVMGASKRACELIVQSYFGNDTGCMMAVRFGNVVGSAGSVVPLFRDQIARGGPVTVTHPEVTRFFMTIPEAAQLILQAGALGKGGETFILEMGTSIKIADMAKDLIRLSGKTPVTDIEIRFTGLRQGEKLYEELITEGEGIVNTDHEKIMVLKADNNWNGHGTQETYRAWIMDRITALAELADRHDGCAIREVMTEIVPEYKSQDSVCVL